MTRRLSGGRPVRRMTPAEAEFDVTDESEVRALLASYEGPVRAIDVRAADQPDAFVSPVGSLRTRRS